MTTIPEICRPAIERGEEVVAELPIRNVNRVTGTITGSEITRKYGAAGLPEDTIRLHFRGSAGQSFGAFVPGGMTLSLEGDANDYLGKGLSGGKIAVFPPRESGFVARDNIIVGNVALYGATGGEAYVRGMAGERFCVRNSGVDAVVEAVGDHGCEYMTGGRVVILGQTGRNFGAGMSGGIAYVLDENGDFATNVNPQMVLLEKLVDSAEILQVRQMIERHVEHTSSGLAKQVLDEWDASVPRFVKVIPKDYKRMLACIARAEEQGLVGDEAIMVAFEENSRDLSRVGGN
jgi:glutamate synthase (ferredoxin)